MDGFGSSSASDDVCFELRNQSPPRPLDLDVGGKRFRTSASTLRKAPFFEALLRHQENGTMQSTVTDEGFLFVDRSPDLFQSVLEYLRAGIAFAANPCERARLRNEFEFFGLDPNDVQLAPGCCAEEVVLGVRWKHIDMATGDKTYVHLRLHGPDSVLDHVCNARNEFSSTGWESDGWARSPSVLTLDMHQDREADFQAVARLLAFPMTKLWELDFRECGRAESSTVGYDSKDDARVHWISETITLRRHT
eukprot:TRINITY_DN75312_c0_g1_i1.p1 TRINITY_DN75312_c0_g1~~TRINITY_DN75312_c0_g1_i1.p1  ORF type:complete len:257 (+),score=44.73 TRINITY_DN75312_c0_g1_i1:22-771(+)